MTPPAPISRPLAAILISATAAAAAAQPPGPPFPDPPPEKFWVRVEPEVVASAETVERARRAVAGLRGIRGLTVLEPTAVDPLTLEYVGTRSDQNRIVHALRQAGMEALQSRLDEAGDFVPAAERAAREAEAAKFGARLGLAPPGRRGDPAEAARRQAKFFEDRGLPNPYRPGRPIELAFDLSEPLGDRAAAASAAVADLPGGRSASFAVPPEPDHRSLSLRTVYADDVMEVVRRSLTDADIPLTGSTRMRFTDEPDEPNEPGEPPAAADRFVGPHMLTITFAPTPGGARLPNLDAEVRRILEETGFAGTKLLLSDWPGRTIVVRYEGTRGEASQIAFAFSEAAMRDAMNRVAATTGDLRPPGRGVPPGREGGPFVTPPGIHSLRVDEFEATPAPPGGEPEPPARELRTATLTLRTPVPGRPAANTAAARRAFQQAGLGRVKLVDADWAAGRVTATFVGYPWGGANLADALTALGAEVVDHTTADAGTGD